MNKSVLAAIAAASLATVSSRASVVFTYENAGVQQTTVAGAVTETFDSAPTGIVGSYTSPVTGGTYMGGEIIPANVYGGAGGGGLYDVVGLGNTTQQTLKFSADKTYFGMWWSAGDGANKLEFRDSGTLLASFTVADLIAVLGPAYYGNPNGGGNAGEPYVYLNFTGTAGTVFDEVDFINLTTAGFESDNHSVYDQPITPPGNPIPDGGSTLALLGGALGLMGWMARRRS